MPRPAVSAVFWAVVAVFVALRLADRVAFMLADEASSVRIDTVLTADQCQVQTLSDGCFVFIISFIQPVL